MKYIDALRCTAEPAWSGLGVRDRMDALQAIERYSAAFQGRGERALVLEIMGEGEYGYYDHADSGHIYISPFALETPEEAVKTVFHEGQHAFQHDCVDSRSVFPEPILDQFQEAFDTYVNPKENFAAYANNFCETDAEDYAEQQSRLLDMERAAVLERDAAGLEQPAAWRPSPSAADETLRPAEAEISAEAAPSGSVCARAASPGSSVRQQAVKGAWEKEADRVRDGKGTWDWTVEQQAEMLSRSHSDNPGVSGFEGSHILSVKDYPEEAGNPDNIQLIPTIAHYDGVHQRNPRGNTPSGLYNPETGEVIPAEDGRIPEQPEFELTDRYDPEQQAFHDEHPDFEQSGEGRRQDFKDTRERHPEKSLKSRKEEGEEKGPKEESPGLDMRPETAAEERGPAPETPEPDMRPAPSAEEKPHESESPEPDMRPAPSGAEKAPKAEEPDIDMKPARAGEEKGPAPETPSISNAESAGEEQGLSM